MKRWAFIDQFRGFAIFSMILVNVCNELPTSPYWLKHHDYGFTFADYVAPAFIFIVGFGYRLSIMKELSLRQEKDVMKKFLRRYSTLTFLGFIYGHFDFKVAVWDALTDIGIAGLLMYPVMKCSGIAILILGFLYALTYQVIFSFTSYGKWLMAHSIDGGPLGPLSWALILAFGAFCAALFERTLIKDKTKSTFEKSKAETYKLLLWWTVYGTTFTVLGFLIAHSSSFSTSLLPFNKSLPLSQRGMTISYSIFASGLCGLSLPVFYVLNELIKVSIPFINTMGKNPLVLYFLQAILIFLSLSGLPDGIKNMDYFHYILAGCILLVCYIVAKILEKKSIYIKV